MARDEFGQPELPTDIEVTADWYAAPDFQLQGMADAADRFGNGYVVTLVVAGGLISGVVESKQAFLRGSGEKLRDMVAEGGDEKAIAYFNEQAEYQFDGVAKIIDDQLAAEFESIKGGGAPKKEVVPRSLMYRFVHLSNALWHGSSIPIDLGHVRVQLSQISAWSVGRP